MKVLFAFAFAVICLSCNAQKAATLPRCMNNPHATQADLNICAGDEVKRLERERNTLYNKVLVAVANDPLATSKVKAAERAWILYRDAYRHATYPLPETTVNYGSANSMEVGLLIAGLTEDHIKDLKALLENYNPSTQR
jgi:uncharacterized protein YecT (DUF1311 family)